MRLIVISTVFGLIVAAPLLAQDAPEQRKPKAEKKSKESGKKKKNQTSPADVAGAKGAMLEPLPPSDENPGDWCEWLAENPGEFYRDKDNPWIDRFRLSGRFHYQIGKVRGEDVRGNTFEDEFEEYRRFRLETTIGFLNYFDLETSVNLVDDRRFRVGPDNSLDWGYDTFDTAVLTFNVGKAFGRGPLDDIKLHYGRMKMPLTNEAHTSSRRILTVERSLIAEKLGGDQSRPTGGTLEMVKGPWSGTLGIFSGEDDSEFIGGWNDGRIYYLSLGWQVNDDFLLQLDHAQNDEAGSDDVLGFSQATSLSAVYEKKRWGVMANLVMGDNGGVANGHDDPLQQGDFHAAVVMPWYWLLKDRLQLVARYQYARADETEGLRMDARYIRAQHNTPTVDLDGGYGDESHSYYLGLNWHLCGDNLKIMGGILHETMSARTDDFDGTTYLLAFRTYF